MCQEIAVGQQEYFEQVIVLTRKKVGESNPYNFDKVQIIELPNKRIQCEKVAFNYLRKIRDKEEYTILCGVWHPEAALSILAGFKNVFILGHGTEFLAGESAFRKYFWLPIYAKWILGKAKLNIANSTYTKGLIHEINPKAKVVALPLGVNEDFFKPSELKNSDNDILKIVTVSRIEQFKGYDFIAKTIANLPEEYKNKIHWNIGGTGPYLQNLQELVRKLGVEKNVTFYGFILDERLPAFYNSNDIFVLCTRENKASTQVEGFGLVFLEAQACGIPVIGTKTGGIADAIENENGGWLIEQDNQIQLTDILMKCIQDKKFMVNQGKIARLRVEQNCTWKLYNNKLFNFLQN